VWLRPAGLLLPSLWEEGCGWWCLPLFRWRVRNAEIDCNMTALPGRGWTAMASVGPAIKNCQEQLRKGSQCLRHCMIQIRWLTWLSLLQWYMVYVKIELRQDRQESRKRIEKGEDFIDCLMRSRSFVSVFFHRPEAWSICVNSPRPWFSPGWERTPMEWPLEALKNGSLKFEMIHKWFMIEERRQNS